jgi:hypothetical protein
MKHAIFGFITLLSFKLNAQVMNNPQQLVTQLFVATDQRDWSTIESIFDEKVTLDYSSMNGNPANSLAPSEITAAWKSILPGFESTHHQIGNFIVNLDQNNATVFCYGTASHYLPDDQGNIWLVVGSYDFELTQQENGTWKITSMKFNFKYQDGNTGLPEKAIQNATSK